MEKNVRQVWWGLAAIAAVIAVLLVTPIFSPSQAVTIDSISMPEEIPQAVTLESTVDTQVASSVAAAVLPQASQKVVYELPASVPAQSKTLDIDALIGKFPYENGQSPPVFPHWQISYERKSIELYGNKKFVSAAVFDLAKFVGDIDRKTKKQDITKLGLIKGFVYPQDQVIAWLNKDYKALDKDEKRMADELIALNVVQKDGDNFKWNKQYDGWPINAYSSAGVFRHERVHVIWLTRPEFAKYFMDDWKADTKGMSKAKKVDYILNSFKGVIGNPPPSRIWWTAVYDQVGEENLVNEFTAHSIEKIDSWRGKTIAL